MNKPEKNNEKAPNNNDIYIPEKNPKPSPVWLFIKYTLMLGLVLFVSFFIVCSYQLLDPNLGR